MWYNNCGGLIMKQASYILMIISTVFMSFLFLIPLAWMIPMTLATKRAQTDGQQHTALGVCTILFAWPFGLIAGIFILVD
jgi:hypothetical protein